MYKYKNARKQNSILKNEKKLKKLHGTISMICSNEECDNKIHMTKEESKRMILCTKCQKSIFKPA